MNKFKLWSQRLGLFLFVLFSGIVFLTGQTQPVEAATETDWIMLESNTNGAYRTESFYRIDSYDANGNATISFKAEGTSLSWAYNCWMADVQILDNGSVKSTWYYPRSYAYRNFPATVWYTGTNTQTHTVSGFTPGNHTIQWKDINVDPGYQSQAGGKFNITVPEKIRDNTLTVNPAGGTWGYTSQPSTPNVYASTDNWDVVISNITSDGYDINLTFKSSFNLSGVTGVQFPTWSNKNGQDDIQWYDANFSGRTATFHVDVSKHKYDMGDYTTHVYLWRNGARESCGGLNGQIKLPTTPYGSNYFPAPSTATRTFALRNYETKDIPVPTREGYEFTGWKLTGVPNAWVTDTAGTGPAQIIMGKMNVTLTATWKQSKYTVHYDGNGATRGSMSDQSATYGQTFNLSKNQFSKSNYTFQGWNTKADGSGTSYRDQQSVTNLTSPGKTITLYAQWKPMKYTVHFEGNGNTGGSMKDQILTIDKAEKLHKNQFTRKDSDFTKWNTRADGKGTSYTDQQTVKNLADGNETITLYAQWDDKPVLKTRSSAYYVRETVTIEQIITENASASDREDGNISHKIIITQIRYNKTGQVVKNPTTFDTSKGQECDVTYQVTDSYGHTVTKVDKVTIFEPTYPDGGDDGEDPLIYSRFISKGYEDTLESNSKWRLNSSYRSALDNALNKAQQMWEAQLRD